MKRLRTWRWLCLLVAVVLGSSPARGEPTGDWVNLLEQVAPARDAVAGSWTRAEGVLRVEAAAGARIALPWPVTSAYDLEVTFIRRTGQDSVAIFFVHGQGQASLELDAWRSHLAGIQNVAGQTVRDNPTRVVDFRLENGRRYTALLRIRSDRVEALLDGQPLATYRGDGSDLSMVDLWRLPDARVLGLGAWDSAVTFERVRVRPMAASEPSAAPKPAAIPEPSPSPVDDLAALSDSFDDPATLRNWRRVFEVEGSGADPLQRLDIGRSRPGHLTLVPHTSSWYQDYRGVLLFKEVTGDFVVTTGVRATGRSGEGAPRSAFSLAGIMVRTPRQVTPATWQPGGENYLFASLGAAREPGRFAFETKTTQSSVSDLEIHDAPGPEAQLGILRIGAHFWVLMQTPGQPWIIQRRFHRPDMPATLQVGMTVYTDWPNVSRVPPAEHNTRVIRGGAPDLLASFDRFSFARPRPDAGERGQPWTDAQVLELLQGALTPSDAARRESN